jgi:rod shape-determining protein MreB
VSSDLALELGSSVTRVADSRGVILLEEPTVAAVDADSRRLIAFGTKALGLGATTAGRVNLVRPVRHGQLMDIALAEDVLVEVVRAAGVSRLAHPRVLACIHAGATDVQQRALDRALRRAGARQVRFVEQPVACAIGVGLPIDEPTGSMVIDVGGGTTDMGVLALGALVTSASLPVGGDDFDEAVRLMLARCYDIVVDGSVASDVRRRIGTVRLSDPRSEGVGRPDLPHLEVRGRDVSSGLPRAVVISADELHQPLEDLIRPLLSAAVECISSAPPDLANDLLGSGLHLAGGGSLLDGLDYRLAMATSLPVHAVANPDRISITGASRCLAMFDALGPSLSAAHRR